MSTRSSHSPAPLRVELRGSRILCACLCLLAGGGLCVIAASALPSPLRTVLALAVLTRLALLLRDQHRLHGALSWRDERWWWGDAGGEHALQLCEATVWPGLIVLRMRIRSSGRRRTFALMADSADPEAQRRLRICLRYMAVFETTARAV